MSEHRQVGEFERQKSKMLVILDVINQRCLWDWKSELKQVGEFGRHNSKILVSLDVITQISW